MEKIHADLRRHEEKYKKFYFKLIAVLFPVFVLLVLEIFLRIFSYGENYKLFVDFPGEEPVKYRIVNRDMGKKYFHKLPHTTPAHDRFLKEKPEDVFRIFVLGSSTVVGFPYDENIMFSRILERKLQDSYPEKHIEVINTAITAINSFTLLDYMNDVLDEDPDAILIYAGHNEYYGAYGVGSVENKISSRQMALLDIKLLSFRFYQLAKNTYSSVRMLFDQKDKVIGDGGTLMKIMANNHNIEFGSRLYKMGIENYTKNVDKMLSMAEQKNVPVFISEVISNVRDIPPLSYSSGISQTDAMVSYTKAQDYEHKGQYIEAKKAYYQAKDRDEIRFRASEEINDAIHELCRKHQSILVPAQKLFFEESSPNGLIGNNLLTEHVHPNIEGYFLLADAFFYKISESNFLGEKLNMINYRSSEYYKHNYGYTVIDSLLGVHRIKSLKQFWPFKPMDHDEMLYSASYVPVSKMDTLSFEVFRNKDYTVDLAHSDMALYHEGRGEYYQASKEYIASIECNPYSIENYLKAADCLLKNNDYPTALKILHESLEISKSTYAYVRIGEIELLRGNYEESIRVFEEVLQSKVPDEIQVNILKKMLEACHFASNKNKENELLAKIRLLDSLYSPSFVERDFDHLHFQLPVQVKMEINYALELFQNNKIDDALDALLHSLQIKETPLANYMVGNILQQKSKKESIVYFIKCYNDYKHDMRFLFKVGVLYVGFKQYEQAKKVLADMKSLDSLDGRVSELSGLIAQKTTL